VKVVFSKISKTGQKEAKNYKFFQISGGAGVVSL
jgi:hypothetical protein